MFHIWNLVNRPQKKVYCTVKSFVLSHWKTSNHYLVYEWTTSLKSGIQKTNKGCTSNLAESKCVSLVAHWYLSQDFRCRKDCESAKYDVQPLFVFCTLISSLISLRKLNNDLMSFTKTVQMIHSTFFWCWQFSGEIRFWKFFSTNVKLDMAFRSNMIKSSTPDKILKLYCTLCKYHSCYLFLRQEWWNHYLVYMVIANLKSAH